ncbi:WD40 repeat domain-containing protein [Candidatus Dependentiae bacterium]|nr:WD40 repeat domain-containing protein [Candidatus Dependentiae bacterium]
MTNFYKSIIFIPLLLTLSNSYSSLSSLQDRAADKTIEALLSQTSQEELSAVISSIPGEIQQRLKNKVLEKYKDALNKALATSFKKLKGHTHWVRSVAFSPCGKFALTGSRDATARLWDLTSETILQTFKGHIDGVTSVAFSPCGKFALTGSADRTARLWDLAAGVTLLELEGHTGSVSSVAFSPCGKYALTGSWDKTARLWDLATGAIIQELKGHTSNVSSVAYSPCGKYALTGSYDYTARLWDLSTGTTIQELKGHTNCIICVALSSCGKYALTGSLDEIARLWDLATGTTIQELKGHTNHIMSVALSPCGKYALTGSRDTTVHLWDLATGSTIKELKGHTNWVSSVTFSPCGNYALTGASDTTACLWFLPQLNILSVEQLLFALTFQEQNINIDDVCTQNLLNSLSSTVDPYPTLSSRDYVTNPLVKAYIDLRRKQLFHAAANDDVDTVKALIKKSFSTVYTVDKAGNNLWHYAFRGHKKNGSVCANEKVLAYLLDVEGKDKGLITPNKAGLYPFAEGLINNKEFTAKFIKGLLKPESIEDLFNTAIIKICQDLKQ